MAENDKTNFRNLQAVLFLCVYITNRKLLWVVLANAW